MNGHEHAPAGSWCHFELAREDAREYQRQPRFTCWSLARRLRGRSDVCLCDKKGLNYSEGTRLREQRERWYLLSYRCIDQNESVSCISHTAQGC